MNSVLLAMMRYESAWERFLFGALPLDLVFAAAAAFTLVFFRIFRRRPFSAPYFSGTFILSLCPFLFCSLSIALDLRAGLSLDSMDYLISRVRPCLSLAALGGSASLAALLAYSLAYAHDRRRFRTSIEKEPNVSPV